MIVPALLALLVVPHVVTARLDRAPTLDGRTDDAAWSAVPATTDLVQKEPDLGQAASEPTRIRVGYTDDAVWIAVDCTQRHSRRIARLTRRDRVEPDDRITVDLDTRADGRSSFHFEVSAAGVLVDGLRYDDTELDLGWDETWTAQVSATAEGWSAELRLPLRILRFDPRTPEWGVQVRRAISARREIDELAPIPRGVAGEVSRYGTLDAPHGVPPPSPLEVRPFVVVGASDRGTGSLAADGSLGVDAKLHLAEDLTLDVTVNPDFGQVETDQAVLNLTSYETVFDEKRPFFLERSDLFAGPLAVLYSRRLGAVPAAPAVVDGEVALDGPSPARILGAAKLTGAAPGGLQIGALAAVTGPARILTVDALGDHHRRLADPLTIFAVARARRDLGPQGQIGGFASAVGRSEGEVPAVAGGRLCPGGAVVADGDCFHDSAVAGLDGRWRSASGAYVVAGDVAGSYVHGGPARPVADGTVLAAGDLSPQAQIDAIKQDDGVTFELEADGLGRRFDGNDVGYVRRANVVHGFAALGWKDSRPSRWLRERHHQLEVFYSQNLAGQPLSGGYQLNTTGLTAGYWHYFSELHWRPANFDDREVGDGTALERAGRLGWELEVGTDPRKAVVATWASGLALLRGALGLEVEAHVMVHAGSRLDLELVPSLTRARGEPRYLDTDANGARRFGDQNADGLGLALRSTYTFSPHATLQLYAQGFADRVGYTHLALATPGDREIHLDELVPAPPSTIVADQRSSTVDGSLVFRWEYRLGSTLFLVYTRSQHSDASTTQAALAKLTYWWGR